MLQHIGQQPVQRTAAVWTEANLGAAAAHLNLSLHMAGFDPQPPRLLAQLGLLPLGPGQRRLGLLHQAARLAQPALERRHLQARGSGRQGAERASLCIRLPKSPGQGNYYCGATEARPVLLVSQPRSQPANSVQPLAP